VKEVVEREVVVQRKNRLNGRALAAYINSRNRMKLSDGVSIYELACLALEDDGMPCPADISYERWTNRNADYIHGAAKKQH
jgi:hypothetical protein